MRNSLTLLQRLCQPLSCKAKARPLRWSIFFLLTLGLTAGTERAAWAETPETAPPQLKNMLAQINAAANSHQAQAVTQFYSPNFTDSDGLTRQGMEKALTQLWRRYPKLNYRTELQSWQPQGNGIVAETVTYITGTQSIEGKEMKLDSTLRSRQQISGEKIVRQEILAEQTQLSSGAKPPTVDVNLPEKLRMGQDYNFDAIVKEPLGDDLLLGAALEEPVKPDAYIKPSAYELEALPAGGIFKMGRAPLKQGSYWVSAVLIRADGITMVTRRLQVAGGSSSGL